MKKIDIEKLKDSLNNYGEVLEEILGFVLDNFIAIAVILLIIAMLSNISSLVIILLIIIFTYFYMVKK